MLKYVGCVKLAFSQIDCTYISKMIWYGWTHHKIIFKMLQKQFLNFPRYLSNDKILALWLTFAPRAVKNNHNRLHERLILKEITFIDSRITIMATIYNPAWKEIFNCRPALTAAAISIKFSIRQNMDMLWLIWLKVKLCIKINLYDNSWSVDYFD